MISISLSHVKAIFHMLYLKGIFDAKLTTTMACLDIITKFSHKMMFYIIIIIVFLSF